MTTTRADYGTGSDHERGFGPLATAVTAEPDDPRPAPFVGPPAGAAAPDRPGARDRRRSPGRPRSEAAEQAILAAVLELLGQGVPYGALSLEQVASRAGVGKATLYRRWANKESLVVDAITTLWTECPSPDLTDGRLTRDHIVEYLHAMAELMRSDRAGLIFASVMATATTNPELVQRYQQVAIEPRREQLRDIVRHGMATGELRSDLDLELIVRMLASPIVHVAKTECLGESLPEGFIEGLVDTMLRGIAR